MSVTEILDVAIDLPNQYPIVTLRETEKRKRTLNFPIGFEQGVALAQAIAKTATTRPVTHELFASVLQVFSIEVAAVRLIGRQQETYIAELDLMGISGLQSVSCRASDGLIMARRMLVPAPILVDERLFDVVGNVEPLSDQDNGEDS